MNQGIDSPCCLLFLVIKLLPYFKHGSVELFGDLYKNLLNTVLFNDGFKMQIKGYFCAPYTVDFSVERN